MKIISRMVVAEAIAWIMAIFASVTLAGTIIFPSAMIQMWPEVGRMGMNTLLALIIASIAILRNRSFCKPAGIGLSLLGTVTLFEAVTNLFPHDGLWRVVINTLVTSHSEWGGRMSILTAIVFLLCGISMSMIRSREGRGAVLFVHGLLSVAFVFVMAGLYGTTLNILPSAGMSAPLIMSVPTGCTLLLLTIALGLIFSNEEGFQKFYARREDRQVFAIAMMVVLIVSVAAGVDELWAVAQSLMNAPANQSALGDQVPSGQDTPRVFAGIIIILSIYAGILLARQLRKIAGRLREQEELLDRVMEHLPVGVWVTNESGQVIRCNHMANIIWQRVGALGAGRIPEYIGWLRDTGERVADEDWPIAKSVLNGGGPLKEVLDIERFDGLTRTILNSEVPLRLETGKIVGAVAVQQDITDNLRLAEELRQAKDFFEELFDRAPIGMGLARLGGDVFKVNQALCNLLGYEAPALMGRNFLEFTHKDDLAHSIAEYEKLQRGEVTHYQIEKRYVHRDGHDVFVHLSVALIEDVQNSTKYVIGQVLDVTESRRVMTELRKWQDIFQHAGWGVVVGSADGTTLEMMNPAFAHMHGFKVDELIGQPIRSVFAPLSRDDLPAHIMRAHETGHYVFESEHIRKNGSIFPVLIDISVVRDSLGSVVYRVVNVQDITERKTIEAALISSEANLRRAQAVAKTGSWFLDVRRNVLNWSPENYRIFGVKQDEPLTYETFLSCVHPDDRGFVDSEWERALQGASYDIEHRIIVHGKVRWVRERAEIELSRDGELLGGVGTTQDITERKLAELELQSRESQLAESQRIAHVGSWEWDIVNGTQVWSEETYRIFGLDPNKVKPDYGLFMSLLSEEDQEKVQRNIELAFAGDGPYRASYKVHRPDGTLRYLYSEAEVQRDSAGNPVVLVGINQDVTERTMFEDLLKSSEKTQRQLAEQMATILDTLPANIALIDHRGVIRAVNHRWEEYARQHGADFSATGVGADYLKVCERAGLEGMATEIASGLRGVLNGDRGSYVCEYNCEHPGGINRYEMMAVSLHAGEGAVVMHLDITERYLAEEKLHVREQEFRALAERSPDMICRLNPEGAFLYVNPAVERVLEKSAEDFLGNHLLDVGFSNLSAERLDNAIRTVLDGAEQAVIEFSHKVRDRDLYFQARLVPELDRHGMMSSVLMVSRDISSLKSIEQMLGESEERFSGIIRNLPGMVFQLKATPDSRKLSFIFMNESVVQLFGVTADSFLINMDSFLQCLLPEYLETFNRTRALSARKMTVWDWEGKIRPLGQTEKWVNLRAMPRRRSDGSVVWDGVMLNVTESKEAEMALAESRQLLRALAAEGEVAREAERKRIAREVHDELGQVLTALRMDVSLLRIQFGAHEPALLDKLLGMMKLVDRAIQSVRDVASNLHPAVMDMGIGSALEWLCDEFEEHTGTPCMLHIPVGMVELDEARAVGVFRIVQESLTNAARYAEAKQILIDVVQDSERLCLSVSDDGNGFDPGIRNTRKSLGLLGMRERALAMGGDVTITSSPGRGTTVFLIIPIESPKS